MATADATTGPVASRRSMTPPDDESISSSAATEPPALPVDRPAAAWRPVRVLVLGVAQALTLLLLDLVFDGLTIDGFWTAVALVVTLAVLNAVVWPLVVRIALPLVVVTVGLFTFVLNALFITLAAALTDGAEVKSLWTAHYDIDSAAESGIGTQ